MFGEDRTCLEPAQQLHAVEKAIGEAKRQLVHDHVDHCLDAAANGQGKPARAVVSEFKAISGISGFAGAPVAARCRVSGAATVVFVRAPESFKKRQVILGRNADLGVRSPAVSAFPPCDVAPRPKIDSL